MEACLHLVMARGVSWVMDRPTANFYPDECWSSWALRCPRSPVAGISLLLTHTEVLLTILFGTPVQSDAARYNSIFVMLKLH